MSIQAGKVKRKKLPKMLVTSNLHSAQDYQKLAQIMSGVLSALANNFGASELGEYMTNISSGN